MASAGNTLLGDVRLWIIAKTEAVAGEAMAELLNYWFRSDWLSELHSGQSDGGRGHPTGTHPSLEISWNTPSSPAVEDTVPGL
jgi:hypothetical protein